MADMMAVNVEYRFFSNARAVFQETARFAALATAALGDFDKSLKTLNATTRETMRQQALLGDAFASTASRAAAGFGRTATAATAAGRDVRGAYGHMSASADLGAEAMATSARDMRVSLASVGVAAEATSARVRASYAAMRTAAVGAGVGGGAALGGAGRFGAGAATVGGFAALATLGVGLSGGADVQRALAILAVQTGRSRADLAREYLPLAILSSNRTAMSLGDTLGVVSQTAGVIKDRGELHDAIAGRGSTGGILDFVNVLKRSNVTTESPAAIAKNVIQLDHILNAYRAPEMAKVHDAVYRAVVGSKMDLGAVVTQAGYFGEQFRLASGGRPGATHDILKLAELGFWGLGHGRWGTGFGQILRTIAHPSKSQIPALEQLGVFDSSGRVAGTTANARGEFTPLAMLDAARTHAAGLNPMQLQMLINRALPANAARVFAEAMSPKTTGFLKRLDASQASMPSIVTAETMLMGNLKDQTARLVTAFQNLANVLTGPLLGPLTGFVSHLADLVGGAGTFFAHHPTATALASGGLALGAGAGVVGLARTFGGGGMRAAIDSAGGVAGRFGAVLAEYLSMTRMRRLIAPGIEGLAGPLARLTEPLMRMLEPLGRGFMMLARDMASGLLPVRWLTGVLARFGLRIVPVVGEIMLLTDALKFFGAHARDIGKVVGEVARWVVKHGAPMLFDAFVQLVKFVAAGVASTIRGIFHGFHGGAGDAGRAFFGGLGEGYGGPDKSKAPQPHHTAADRPHAVHRIAAHATHGMHPHVVAMGAGAGAVHVHGNIEVKVATIEHATPAAIEKQVARHFDRTLTSAHYSVIAGNVARTIPGLHTLHGSQSTAV